MTSSTSPTITPEQQHLAERILAGDLQADSPMLAVVPSSKPLIDVHQLIAAAQASMGVKPIEKPGQVEAADPAAINALVALAAEHKRQADFHAAERKAITEALSSMIVAAEDTAHESIDALTVHGAPLFTYKAQITRTLNQSAVKAAFPDIPENARFYTETVTRRAVYK